MFTIDVHISGDMDLTPNDTKTGVLVAPIAYLYPVVRLNLFLGGDPESIRANGRYLIEAIERVIELQHEDV